MRQKDKEHLFGRMDLPITGRDENILKPDLLCTKGLYPQLMRGIDQILIRKHFNKMLHHLWIKMRAGLGYD